MEKSIFTPAYAVLRQTLVAMRKAAGLTQRQLAEKLRRERSFVARIEQGERRLDLVEFCWICEACGVPALKMIRPVVRAAGRTRGTVGRPLAPRPARVRTHP